MKYRGALSGVPAAPRAECAWVRALERTPPAGQWPLCAEGPAGDKGPLCVGAASERGGAVSARHSERPECNRRRGHGCLPPPASRVLRVQPPFSLRTAEPHEQGPALSPRPSWCPDASPGGPGPTLPASPGPQRRLSHEPPHQDGLSGMRAHAGAGSGLGARPTPAATGVRSAPSPVPGQARLWAQEAVVWEQDCL